MCGILVMANGIICHIETNKFSKANSSTIVYEYAHTTLSAELSQGSSVHKMFRDLGQNIDTLTVGIHENNRLRRRRPIQTLPNKESNRNVIITGCTLHY